MPKQKIIVISHNKFSQESAVLRKIVVQTRTLLLAIPLFTVVILFVVCARKPGYILPLVKKRRH